MQVYVAAFGVAWCAVVTFGFIEALVHQPSVAIIPAAMLGFGLTLTYRMLRISARSRTEHTCDSSKRRHQTRPTRSDVEDSQIGRPSNQPIGKTIHLLLRDHGIVAIDAAARPYVTHRGKLQLAQRQAELKAWLSKA